ncbi:MAG TPA: ribosome small subunit-dependent GTPase A [Thermomicrobiales bacterium]|nr:ribosome small subunit-dependent GTPase A [Thermomicrobiales bacterium]
MSRKEKKPAAISAAAASAPIAAPPGAQPGIVVRAYGKFFDVALRDGGPTLLSTVRGGLKRERRKTDLVAVGDRVLVTDLGQGEGQIERVEPRARALGRLARLTDDVEQVILANPDQALFLFAVREPAPHLRMLDRFLALAESRRIPALIGVNKIDLDVPAPDGGPSLAHALFGVYETHYPVLYLSAFTGDGVPALRDALAGKITAVAGPSGVGKSSLLNLLDPEGARAVGALSGATGKGRHTTSATILRRLPGASDAYVADSPGIRALALHGVTLEDLDTLYPEFRPYLGRCFYPDCTHLHEPGCAIREAVEEGVIPRVRFESYAALRRGDDDSGRAD